MTLSLTPTTKLPFGTRLSAAWLLVTVLSAAGLVACGGAQTPPPEDPPLLDQPSEEEQAPSSENVKKASDLIKAEKYQEAADILKEETTKAPEDPQAAFFYGVALEKLEQPEEAVKWYTKAGELQPKLLEAHQNLSALLLDLEDPKGALAAADKGLALAPEDPGLLINRAYAVDLSGPAEGKNEEAISAYEAAIKVVPTNLNLKYYYAAALGRAGEKDKALAELDKLPLDGKEVPIVEIVTVYGELDAFDACATALGKQIAKEKTVELLIHQSSCYVSGKKAKEAEAALRDAVASFPESDVAHYYLAKYLDGAGKKAEAKKHLDKANALKKAKAE